MTYNGISFDTVKLDETTSDRDIKRIAAEVVSSGQVASLNGEDHDQISPDAFSNFVVDRLQGTDGTPKIYLRPKVPFGADSVLPTAVLSLQDDVKGVALNAVGASAELTSLLLDILNEPAELGVGASKSLAEGFLALNESIQELQGLAASLTLLNTVQGQKP